MILLGFKVFAIQLDLIAQGIALRFDLLIEGFFLKFLGIVEILLANNYEVLELER